MDKLIKLELKMDKLIKLELKGICKKYNTKLRFSNINFDACFSQDGGIVLNKNLLMNRESLIQILFHELGHKYCFDNNLFVAYHHETDYRLVRLTGLKAERFVDRWAAKELKKCGYDFNYEFFYYQKNRTKNMKNYLKDTFK